MKPGQDSPSPDAGVSEATKRTHSEHLKLEIELLDAPRERPDAQQPSTVRSDAMKTVLIVDDDEDMCTYVSRCLKAIRFPLIRADVASDGVEALEMLASSTVDLIVSDVLMPRMDGITLCARLYEHPELRTIPVLLMSGEVALDEVRRSVRHDVGLIAKPFSARTLGEAIDRLAGHGSPTDDLNTG